MNVGWLNMSIPMGIIKYSVIVFVLLLIFFSGGHAQEQKNPIELTPEEKTWLKAHPTIRLAYPPGHEPTLMEDDDGKLIGVLADYFELINQRLETNISLTLVPWLEVDEKIRNKEIEGLVAAMPRKVEALGLLPTQRKFSSYVVVYGQGHADSLKFPDDLQGRRVAVLSGYNHTDFAVDQIRDKAEIIPVKSPREGLELVHQSRVDFFIGAISNNYLVSKYQLFGIGALHVFWDQPYRAGPAVRSDLPELASILKKSVSLITDEEFEAIVARWTKVRRVETQVELTSDERIWLEQHPNIVLGFTAAFEPGIIINEDGSYRGTLVDILELLNQRLGTAFKPTAESIPELIRQVNDKELAGVLSVHSDWADKLGWLRTKSFMNSYPTIFLRKGSSFAGPSDLAGKRIALIDNVFFSKKLVDLYGVGSTLIKVKNGREGLEAVRNGNADLYLGSSRNSYLLNKYQFYDLIASFQFYNHPVPNVMGIRSDWPELVSILNKGFDSIAIEEIDPILRKWGSTSETEQALPLTIEEQTWLSENLRIGVGVSSIPPYTFSEKDKEKGYLVDMMELLVSQVGLAVDYSINKMDENLSLVKDGKLHTVLGVLHNKERAGFMYFSQNVMKVEMSIFAASSRGDIRDITSLTDKTIASYKGYGFEPTIKSLLPNATIIQSSDVEGMLRLVASGEADAAVQELYSGEYVLRDNFINGVNRKGNFFPPGQPLITGSEFGVSKKYPLLSSILNKAYDVLPESEKNRVWRKWFSGDTTANELIELTDKEKSWIATHPKIVLGTDSSWAPYVILGEDGSVAGGIDVDLINLLNKKLGTNIQLTTGNWNEIVEQGKTHEIDGLTTSAPLEARLSHFLFSSTYLRTFKFIVIRKDAAFDVHSLKDLVGLRVATQKGIGFDRKLLGEVSNVSLVESASHADSIDLVMKGEADAALVGSGVSYRLSENQMSGIIFAYWVKDKPLSFVYSIRNDWPELVNIINKGIAAITEAERSEILKKYYLEPLQDDVDLQLSVNEKAWLNKNNNVRVRAIDWPPYMIINENGIPEGISVDYLKLISERTGINFEYEITKQPFADFLENMKQHQGPDMTTLIVATPEREQYLSFTTPYISSPYVIFARDHDEIFLDLQSLNGKTLSVSKGFIIQNFLKRDFPDINLALFDNSEQALLAVSTGELDAYIGNLTVSAHILQKQGLSNLRIAGSTPYGDQVLSMGNRKDWPELTSIMNKVLASITEEEKVAILNKYIALKYEQGLNKAKVIQWVLVFVVVTATILFLFVFWNRQLSRRVRQRTAALEDEMSGHLLTNAKLAESEARFRATFEQAAVGIAHVSMDGHFLRINRQLCDFTGYGQEELLQLTFREITPAEDLDADIKQLNRLVSGDITTLIREKTYLRKDGSPLWALVTVSLVQNEQGQPQWFVAVVSDISERKKAQIDLKQIREYTDHLIQTASVIIISLDNEGRITHFNPAAENITGYNFSEIQEKEWFETLVPRDRYPEVHDEFERLMRGEFTRFFENPILTKSGQERHISWSNNEIRRGEEVIGVTSFGIDITERKLAEESVQQYQQRLKALASQLTIAEERERRRLAAELHDHVGQSLVFSRIQLSDLKEQTSDERFKESIDEVSQSLLGIIRDTRELVFDLSSPLLHEVGLAAATSQWLREDIGKKYGLETECVDNTDKIPHDNEIKALLYRNIRELLTNVVKHAYANKVTVHFNTHKDNLVIAVEDNGIGMNVDCEQDSVTPKGGFGLFSIQERIDDIGGSLEIESQPGKGCKATMKVPFSR